MTRPFAAALALACLVSLTGVASAELSSDDTAAAQSQDERLLIVNGNTGRVIYDDGKNDLFCVTRRVVVSYNWDGRPVYRRTMRCR